MRKAWLSLLFVLGFGAAVVRADTCTVWAERWECTNIGGCGTQPSCYQVCTLTTWPISVPCGQSGTGIGGTVPTVPTGPTGTNPGTTPGTTPNTTPLNDDGSPVVPGTNDDGSVTNPDGTLTPAEAYDQNKDCYYTPGSGYTPSTSRAEAIKRYGTAATFGAVGAGISFDEYLARAANSVRGDAYVEVAEALEIRSAQEALTESLTYPYVPRPGPASGEANAIRYIYGMASKVLTDSQARTLAQTVGRPLDYIIAKGMGIRFLAGGVVGTFGGYVVGEAVFPTNLSAAGDKRKCQ
jgi:hypothetical protein